MFGFLLGSYCAKLYVDIGYVDMGEYNPLTCIMHMVSLQQNNLFFFIINFGKSRISAKLNNLVPIKVCGGLNLNLASLADENPCCVCTNQGHVCIAENSFFFGFMHQ